MMIPAEEFSEPTEKMEETKADGADLSHMEKEIKDFKLCQIIGGGAYGTVYLAQLKEDENQFYAIKAMSKAATVKAGMIEMVLLEQAIMVTNEHPNMITMKWLFQTKKYLFFVMPFIQGGELY
jgi:serine/threonine protein kinase